MTTVYNSNYDAETAGVIASGFANKVGTWQVAADDPVSGANAFGSNSNGDGDVALITGIAASADMQIDTSQKVSTGGPAFPLMGHVLRSDSANNNHYVIVFSTMSAAGGNILIFKKVGGSYTLLSTQAVSLAQALGDTIRLRTRISGSNISVWVGNGSLPGSPSATLTDSSITAAGYAGLYNGKDGVSAITMTIDDMTVDDLASSSFAISSHPSNATRTAPVTASFSVAASGGTPTYTYQWQRNPGGVGGWANVSGGSGGTSATYTTPATSVSGGSANSGDQYRCVVTDSAGSPASVTSNAATLTVNAGGVGIATSDSNWKFSPYNWATVSGAKVAVNGGAYCRLGFTGTGVTIDIDVSSMVSGGVDASWYPSIRYSVDNGPQTDLQLTPSTTGLTISGLASGTHSIEIVYLRGWWENIGGTAPDRWTTPVYCLKITGATIDAGASTAAPTWLSNSMFWAGDSISEGIRAQNTDVQPACQNAYESVPMFLAQAMGCELGNVSFGGQNYAAGFSSIPAFNTAYASVFNGQSRLSGGVLSPAPAHVCIWHGANGGASSGDVQAAIGNMRTVAPSADIWVIVPVGGVGRSGITSGVSAYLAANPAETKVYLIDLGASWEVGLTGFGSATKQAVDNLHPRANWNARIACAIVEEMAGTLAGGGGSPVGFPSSSRIGGVIQ